MRILKEVKELEGYTFTTQRIGKFPHSAAGMFEIFFEDDSFITFKCDFNLEERYFTVGSVIGRSNNFAFTSAEEFEMEELGISEFKILNRIVSNYKKEVDNYFYRKIADFYFHVNVYPD